MDNLKRIFRQKDKKPLLYLHVEGCIYCDVCWILSQLTTNRISRPSVRLEVDVYLPRSADLCLGTKGDRTTNSQTQLGQS